MEKVLLVATYLINKGIEEGKPLTPLKLQKLLYYAQAWSLVFNKKRLFDNQFQAWVHGPAIPEVWAEYRDFDFGKVDHSFLEENFKNLDEEERQVLELVWSVYGKFDGKYLEHLTHTEEPWLEARRGMDDEDPSQNIISEETMRVFYERRLEEARRAS